VLLTVTFFVTTFDHTPLIQPGCIPCRRRIRHLSRSIRPFIFFHCCPWLWWFYFHRSIFFLFFFVSCFRLVSIVGFLSVHYKQRGCMVMFSFLLVVLFIAHLVIVIVLFVQEEKILDFVEKHSQGRYTREWFQNNIEITQYVSIGLVVAEGIMVLCALAYRDNLRKAALLEDPEFRRLDDTSVEEDLMRGTPKTDSTRAKLNAKCFACFFCIFSLFCLDGDIFKKKESFDEGSTRRSYSSRY
jgi:hypothetical protein